MSNTSNSTCRLQSRLEAGIVKDPERPPSSRKASSFPSSMPPKHASVQISTKPRHHCDLNYSGSPSSSQRVSFQRSDRVPLIFVAAALDPAVTQMPGTKWTGTGAWPSSASGVRGASQCKGGTSDDEGLSALAE